MGSPLGVGLRLADQRCQLCSKHLGALRSKAVIDLPGIDQVVPFTTTDIQAIPIIAVEGKPGNRQRLALWQVTFTQSFVRPIG